MANERRETLRQLATFSNIGMTFVFSIFIGIGFGYYLDNTIFDGKTSPYLTCIFFAFGIAAAFKNLFMVMKELDKE